MKTTKLVSLLVLALALGACGDDGGNDEELPSGCGNSFAYNDTNAYGDLAGVLADDVLLLDMSQTQDTCGYLGIEAEVANACGGRMLDDDVVDISYSVLATGETSGVGDGVDGNPEGAFDTMFPYLLAPN